MLFLASGSCQIYNAAAASRWSPNIIPASVLSAKVNGVGGRHSSHYQLGWQRCFEQLKRLESTNNLHLLQVFGSVSCVQSSCIVRVPCMATLPNLGNVRRVVVDPTRPRGQSKLWPGWSTGKRIGVTRTILANCVVFCGGVAIPVAQEAEAVKPTHSVACGMLVNVNPWRRKVTTLVAKAKARDSACRVATGCRKASGTRSCVTTLATTFAWDTYRPQEEVRTLDYLQQVQQEVYHQPLRSKYKATTREPASAFERPSPLSATHSARLAQRYPPHALESTPPYEAGVRKTLLPHLGRFDLVQLLKPTTRWFRRLEVQHHVAFGVLLSRNPNSARTKTHRLAGSYNENKDSKPTTSLIAAPHPTAQQAHAHGGRPQRYGEARWNSMGKSLALLVSRGSLGSEAKR